MCGGVRAIDTDKNPVPHVIPGDGGSVSESPRRDGVDPKHSQMWFTLIITHTAQEDMERFIAHITRLSVENRAASQTSSFLGTDPGVVWETAGSWGLVVFR